MAKLGCKYCEDGAPLRGDSHWIVKSIAPAEIKIIKCKLAEDKVKENMVSDWMVEAGADKLAEFYPGKPRTQLKAQAQLILEAADSAAWESIATAPRDGSEIEIRGSAGPYGVTEWQGRARWGTPVNWHRRDSCWVTPDSNAAVLHLAGYIPTHWRSLRGSL